MRSIAAIILSLVCSSVAWGQIKLVEKISETPEIWTGFIKPVINEDGTITASPGSKPMLASPSVKTFEGYAFETSVPYKFNQLKVKRKATGESVSMLKDANLAVYSFRAGTTPGVYVFAYTVFDSERGIDSEEFEVEYKLPIVNPVPGPVPVPVPVPGPVIVDPTVNPEVLIGIPEEARVVMLGYVKSMTNDMRIAAKELKAENIRIAALNAALAKQMPPGKPLPLPTLMQMQQRGQDLDTVSRTNFKQVIGGLMNKYLSDPPSAETFDLIATGYEAVK